MATLQSYPHFRINVEDRSIFEPVVLDVLPLHRPLYPMKTQKGPVGIPVWCPTIVEAREIFGAETFNLLNTTFYSQSSEFLVHTFPDNGAFITRLVDDVTATKSILIFEVSTVPVQVPQFQVDGFGNRILDGLGDPVPELDGGGAPVFEAGIEMVWSTRTALAGIETLDTIQIASVDDGFGVITTTYPIIAFESDNAGTWGNDLGIKLFHDINDNQIDSVTRNGSVFFDLAPVLKEFNASTLDPIRDRFGDIRNKFIFKPGVIDETLQQFVSIRERFESLYSDGSELPFAMEVYTNNIFLVGEEIRTVEVNRAVELADGWFANSFTLTDLAGKPYDHVVFGAGSSVLNEAVVHYLAGGTDGDITDTGIESLYQNLLSLDINPDIVDRARYPFTHIFDVGWSIDTKYAIADFLAVRDDIKVALSTQRSTDVGGVAVLNTESEDDSLGRALHGRAILIPESVIKGTSAFRANVFAQAGKTFTNYQGIIPVNTLWYATKLAFHHNTTFMDGEPAGLPNSKVDVMRSFNWAPAAESERENLWNAGINYFQYYTMSDVHIPALRTVYRFDTSVLTTDDFANALVYSKHEIRQSWATFAGVTRESGVLHEQITNDLTDRLSRMVNGRYAFTVRVFQTVEEQKLGYQHHITVSWVVPGQNRVSDVDVVVNRENFVA